MTFQDFKLNKFLHSALDDLGITTPTVIQEKTFKTILAGKDVVGIAQTGTGKTFAFLLPLMRNWKFTKTAFPQILIMVPTRELVAQVVTEIEKLAKYMNFVAVGVYGGTNMRPQKEKISEGADAIVGTPGRLMDLMKDGVLKTKMIKHLVIDEVDEMLNLGFRTQLRNVVDFLPERRQNLMFSATMIPEVEEIITEFTSFYEKIEAAPSGAPLENILQQAYPVPNFNTKANLLEMLLNRDESMAKVLVFVSTKKLANALFERMEEKYPESVAVIHSSKSQNNRFDAVNNFQAGTIRFLINTDIIARGLDVHGITHIINFDLPDNPEKYIHRIGRTGRAEEKGIAISFIAEKDEKFKEQIEALMDKKIELLECPEDLVVSEELIDLEKPVEHIPFNNHKVKQFTPSGPAFHEKKEKNKKVNVRKSRADKMKEKYKKPLTRGQKKRKSKKSKRK